jgi:hypothetical protein
VRRARHRVTSRALRVTGTDLEEPPREGLTELVKRARRGLRRDVAALEAGLDEAELFVPLRSHIAGAPEGEAVALDRELEILPHLLRDEEGRGFAVLFTDPELVEALAGELGWQTDGRELSVCALPGRVACELSLGLVDEDSVFGLVIDPGHPSELMLRRAELASIAAGTPVPLVGYLEDLPPLDDEQVLLAEPSDPPPRAFVEALERCIAGLAEVTLYRLERTFNPDRDLEPHLTLRLTTASEADRRALAERVIAAVGEQVPPPGYIDILFEDA